MNAELRKRLEEAAYNIFPRKMEPCRVGRSDANQAERMNFEACAGYGAELGYKRAIELAKKWILENTISHYNPDTDARWVDTNECEDNKEFAYRFETDMNKLWEE